jgi:hypothetical protein
MWQSSIFPDNPLRTHLRRLFARQRDFSVVVVVVVVVFKPRIDLGMQRQGYK